jgi:hypothetical protein
MVTRTSDGTLHTEPLDHNGDSYGQPVVVTEDGQAEAWKNWVQGTLDNERAVMMPWVEKMLGKLADELLDLIEPHLKKITKLEGAADTLDRETIKSAAVDMERHALEDRLHALELKVAQAEGVIGVLRGRGVPGSLNVKGTYDPSIEYHALDIVALNGGSFVARRDAPGPCPGDDWQLLASAGKRGARGERGVQGFAGPAGRDGADAPLWSSVSFDPKRLAFMARMSDGSLGPEISLRLLFADVGVDPRDYSIKLTLNDGSELKFSLRGLFEQFFHELKGR